VPRARRGAWRTGNVAAATGGQGDRTAIRAIGSTFRGTKSGVDSESGCTEIAPIPPEMCSTREQSSSVRDQTREARGPSGNVHKRRAKASAPGGPRGRATIASVPEKASRVRDPPAASRAGSRAAPPDKGRATIADGNRAGPRDRVKAVIAIGSQTNRRADPGDKTLEATAAGNEPGLPLAGAPVENRAAAAERVAAAEDRRDDRARDPVQAEVGIDPPQNARRPSIVSPRPRLESQRSAGCASAGASAMGDRAMSR